MSEIFNKNFAAEINRQLVDIWQENIIPQLCDYIKIPNKSPLYDANWKANGHMDRAMNLIVNWCKKQPIANI